MKNPQIMTTLLILIYLMNLILADQVKYNGSRSWPINRFPNRPCRSEEGYNKCDSILSGQTCITRYTSVHDSLEWYTNFEDSLGCMDFEPNQCNDDEFETRHDFFLKCESRPSAVNVGNYAAIYLPCHSDEYECKTTGKCIPRFWVGDGVDDCSLHSLLVRINDTSDETDFFETCNEETEYRCNGDMPRCIPRYWVMDGKYDCPHKDDESKAIPCHNVTEFLCATNKRCILRRYVNDGFSDCPNNDDENVANFTCTHRHEFQCNHFNSFSRCIPRAWRGNDKYDCARGDDEREYVASCFPDEFKCLDNTRCLPIKYLCDGIQNCRDGSDEIELCSSPTMHRAINNGLNDPDRLMPWSFYILDDGYNDIVVQPDLMFGFKCYVYVDKRPHKYIIQLRTIPQCYINNNISLCYNKEDVCFDGGRFVCARCLDGTIISKSQVCDNTIDCRDLSDEYPCEVSRTTEIGDKVYSWSSSRQEKKLLLEKVCNGVIEMEDEADEKFCNDEVLAASSLLEKKNRSSPVIEFECTSASLGRGRNYSNGTLKLYEAMKNCFPFISLPTKYKVSVDNSFVYYSATFNTSTLQLRPPITVIDHDEKEKYDIADICQYRFIVVKYYWIYVESRNVPSKGENECPLTGMHSNLHFMCEITGVKCPWFFYCESDKSQKIEFSKRCDHQFDCVDQSDEADCPYESHFYCKNGNPSFIPSHKVGDGRFDCADRSDECRETAFSSSAQMLKSQFLRYLNWIWAILIIITNGVVIRKHIRKWKSISSHKSTSYCNTLLLTNLAVSDVIFGFILLTIAIKSLQFSGNYCEFDLEWRSGLSCNIVGIFTVISAQTSVNILVLMTAFNLYVTYWPFTPTSGHVNVLRFLCVLSWGAAVFLSMFPIWAGNHFTHSYIVEPNAYLNGHIITRGQLVSYVEKTEKIITFNNLSYISARNFSSDSIEKHVNEWYFNTVSGRTNFPNRYIDVTASFGFYSSSSVCLPDLYTQTSPASEYSLAIILWNLLSLIFIALGYFLIFKRVTNTRNSTENPEEARESKKQKKMLKRIIYIVLTDVICWLPIIAMTILSYSGYHLPEIVHPISAIVLLPINSLINPIIYSRLDKEISQQLSKLLTSICSQSNSGTTSTVPAVSYHRVTKPLTTVTYNTEIGSDAEAVQVLTQNTA